MSEKQTTMKEIPMPTLRTARRLAAIAALALLPGCGLVCGPEPRPDDRSQAAADRHEWAMLRWNSCMGRLHDPAPVVRIVR